MTKVVTMVSTRIFSKVLILEDSNQSAEEIKEFFDEIGLIGLKATSSNTIVDLLKKNIDLGAVFLSDNTEEKLGSKLAEEIHRQRPELPILVRTNEINYKDIESSGICDYYCLEDKEYLSDLVNKYLFNYFYPAPMIDGVQEVSEKAFKANFFDAEITCDPAYLVKDNIIYGELFSLISLDSDWCRGYMMLQTTMPEVVEMISKRKTHLPEDATGFRDVNDLLNEITNLIWGGIRARFFKKTDPVCSTSQIQVPILVNHLEKFISFGTTEPQLCFRYTIKDNVNNGKSIVVYQKFIFNLDWRPEAFKDHLQSVDVLVDSGELEFF